LKGIIKYSVEMGSGGIINLPSLIKIGTGAECVLSFCLSNFKTVMLVLLVEGFMKCTVEMGSRGRIYYQLP
jgi:hypothetical protein